MNQNYEIMTKARLKELAPLLANVRGVFWQRSKIRIELPILPGVGRYTFDLKKESFGNGITTFPLKRDDVIVPNGIGVLLSLSHKVNGTEVEELFSFAPKNDGKNPSVFPVGFTSNNIESLYNGFFEWTVGSLVAWDNYAMESFKKVFRQQGAFVLNSDDAAVQEGIQPEHDIYDLLQPILAKYFVSGMQDHQMTVNFPAAGLEFPLNDETYTAKLVLYIDCFKAKNGTKLLNVVVDGRKVSFEDSDNPLVVSSWTASNA